MTQQYIPSAKSLFKDSSESRSPSVGYTGRLAAACSIPPPHPPATTNNAQPHRGHNEGPAEIIYPRRCASPGLLISCCPSVPSPWTLYTPTAECVYTHTHKLAQCTHMHTHAKAESSAIYGRRVSKKFCHPPVTPPAAVALTPPRTRKKIRVRTAGVRTCERINYANYIEYK